MYMNKKIWHTNNLHWLICRKTQPNQQPLFKNVYLYLTHSLLRSCILYALLFMYTHTHTN